MKIVIDTNIIFSALLNTNGTIGDLLFNTENKFSFYSCNYMRHEIEKHWGKLKKISNLSDEALKESQLRVFSKIRFINEELIPEKTWIGAEKLVFDVDQDDIGFVALTNNLDANLWTRDKELYNCLHQKNFKNYFLRQNYRF